MKEQNFQEQEHPEGHDYLAGSPHLKHPHLKSQICVLLSDVVRKQLLQNKKCNVLEVGAGQGAFTDVLIKAGAQVTLTEMSLPSVRLLEEKYENNQHVTVVFDETGTWHGDKQNQFQLIVCISVLHHIPDYLGFLSLACQSVTENGVVVTFQDPLWYPRRSKVNLLADKGAYFAWRITQGQLRRGIQTRVRRIRGIYDENNPADMAEYHVVRKGLDEEVVLELLNQHFEDVNVVTYWSTQNAFLQRCGELLNLKSTFGVCASKKRA